jgi:ABC-2 type transport system permease protein
MTLAIIRKEILELTRDGRFRWGGFIVLVLLSLSLLGGWFHRHQVEEAHTAAQAMSWSQWIEQGDKNPHSAAHFGVHVFRPTSPLSFVDQGVDGYVGSTTLLEAHYQNPFSFRAVQDAPGLARFADLTAATTLQLLIPLLILLMTYQAVSGERERGTLRQLLSLGVSPVRLGAGKALGVSVGLLLLLAPAAMVGALALFMAGPGDGAVGNEVLRFALLALAYLGYFMVFVLLALAVSALAPSSRVALGILLGLWALNGLVAPRVASDIARMAIPLPSGLAFQAAVSHDLANGFDDHPPQAARQAILRDSVLAAYGVASPEELPFNFAGLRFQSGEEFANLVFDRHFGSLKDQMAAQGHLHQLLGFVAPHLAIRSLSMALAGTDPWHHARYADAAEEQRRLMQRILNEDIMVNSRAGETYLASADLWSRIPPLEYAGPPVTWALESQQRAIVVLLFWLALAGLMMRRGLQTLGRRI